jgi:hypothetical protein
MSKKQSSNLQIDIIQVLRFALATDEIQNLMEAIAFYQVLLPRKKQL